MWIVCFLIFGRGGYQYQHTSLSDRLSKISIGILLLWNRLWEKIILLCIIMQHGQKDETVDTAYMGQTRGDANYST